MFIQHQKKLYVNKLEDLSLLKFQRGYLYFLKTKLPQKKNGLQ